MKKVTASEQSKWVIDPAHSEIGFKVRHLMIANVRGIFKTFDASICTSGRDFRTSEVDLWIDPSTLKTGVEKRDKQLKNRDFLNVRKFNQITFTSSTLVKADEDGKHELWGELTMMGITYNVKLNVQFGGILNDSWGNERAGFSVTGNIKWSDWGLTWNATTESNGLMVSDEVSISCEVELTKIGQKVLSMHLD